MAKACGYTHVWHMDSGERLVGVRIPGYHVSDVPDYPHDLNAMAAAEQTLDSTYYPDDTSEYDDYIWALTEVCQGALVPEDKRNHPVSATAAQRAEAFLRTKGLWQGGDAPAPAKKP